MQNENFVAYYKSMMQPPPGLNNPQKTPKLEEKTHRKGSHKRRRTQDEEADEIFYNSSHYKMINDLVDEQITPLISAPIVEEPVITTRPQQQPCEDNKHIESANTTNHSTGNSQNSSSAEKVKCVAPTEVEDPGSSSSCSEEREGGYCVPNEILSSFITDSPFSFKNPIFFSVPRDQQNMTKQAVPINSRRKLFFGEENALLPPRAPV